MPFTFKENCKIHIQAIKSTPNPRIQFNTDALHNESLFNKILVYFK